MYVCMHEYIHICEGTRRWRFFWAYYSVEEGMFDICMYACMNIYHIYIYIYIYTHTHTRMSTYTRTHTHTYIHTHTHTRIYIHIHTHTQYSAPSNRYSAPAPSKTYGGGGTTVLEAPRVVIQRPLIGINPFFSPFGFGWGYVFNVCTCANLYFYVRMCVCVCIYIGAPRVVIQRPLIGINPFFSPFGFG
jgi:hypothetical protein